MQRWVLCWVCPPKLCGKRLLTGGILNCSSENSLIFLKLGEYIEKKIYSVWLIFIPFSKLFFFFKLLNVKWNGSFCLTQFWLFCVQQVGLSAHCCWSVEEPILPNRMKMSSWIQVSKHSMLLCLTLMILEVWPLSASLVI